MSEKHLEKRSLIRLMVFGCLTLVFGFLSVFGLIRNSQGAIDRYNALLAVDEAGGDVDTALNELRVFIYGHMNTKIGSDLGINPPIQLRGTYERLLAEQEAELARSDETLYQEAQADCEARQPEGFSGRNRIECIEQYIDANGKLIAPTQPIEDDLYKFDFAPPLWSPDLAGFSILLFIVCGFIFIIVIFLYFRTRHLVHLAN